MFYAGHAVQMMVVYSLGMLGADLCEDWWPRDSMTVESRAQL